jgi:hypothetical protein
MALPGLSIRWTRRKRISLLTLILQLIVNDKLGHCEVNYLISQIQQIKPKSFPTYESVKMYPVS